MVSPVIQRDLANQPCRIASDERIWRHIPCDDAPSTDDGAFSDSDALQNDHPRTEPCSASDKYWFHRSLAPIICTRLPPCQITPAAAIADAMIIAVGNDPAVRDQHIILNFDRRRTVEQRSPANKYVITDPNDAALFLGHQSALNEA